MPTLEEWESAPQIPRLVAVDSSPRLIADVQQRQAEAGARLTAQGKVVKPRKPLAPVSGLPQEIWIKPVQLLHRLGVITTPAIENIVDVCSTWANFRYLWAFELPDGGARDQLRLSQHAISIDFHQKGLMSDHIGVGMAALLMEMMNAPYAADVSVAMKDPTWPIGLTGNASPDYLFFNNDRSILYVVECKGTRCERNSALDQLMRGAEQLPSLTFTDGRTQQPPSLVIGTQMTSQSVRVHVIDPPSEYLPTRDLPKRIEMREWIIPESKVIEDPARHVSQIKILSYAGLDEDASAKRERLSTPLKGFPRFMPRETTLEENEFGTFRGVRQRVPVRDNLQIEVFQAVQESLREAYVQDDVDRIQEESRKIAPLTTGASTESGMTSFEVDRRSAARIVRDFAPDGTLLEIKITPT